MQQLTEWNNILLRITLKIYYTILNYIHVMLSATLFLNNISLVMTRKMPIKSESLQWQKLVRVKILPEVSSI